MTRPLLLTAAFGFVAAFVCFAAAALMGPMPWSQWDGPGFGPRFMGGPGHHWHGWRGEVSGDGPQTSRDLAWTGTDALAVRVPAEVTYTQGPASHVAVTGPQGMVDHLVDDDGVLRFDAPVYGDGGDLKITVTAPSVRDFVLDGAGKLTIAGFDQDHMSLTVRGSGDIAATGKAHDLELNIAGSGDGDLGGLAVDSAEVRIAGSGDATIAPRQRARVKIAGSGDVTLTTQPPDLDSKILGSGRILHAAPPPQVPAPTPAPPKKG